MSITAPIQALTIYPKHRAAPIPRYKKRVQRRRHRVETVLLPTRIMTMTLNYGMGTTLAVSYVILVVWLFGLAVQIQSQNAPILPTPAPLENLFKNAGLPLPTQSPFLLKGNH